MGGTFVTIVRCRDYDSDRVRAAVRRAVRLLPNSDCLLEKGRRVLLKPNLLSSHDPVERAVNTHPEFVRAVAEVFLDVGCEVLVGDSTGALAPGSTEAAMKATGLLAIADELGVQLVDFDRAPTKEVPIPDGRVLKTLRIPRCVHELDLFVTLPKFKTHGLTMLTGAIKNQMGLVPGKGKKDIHLAAPKPAAMDEALVDIFSVAVPHLAIVDAVVGMEGNGPAAGDSRHVGLILASEDCVAVDAVAAEIMGCRAGQFATARLAQERGLGIAQLENISVLGERLEDVVIPDFRKPPVSMSRKLGKLIPNSLLRKCYDVLGSSHATILHDRCVLCGECVANCPAQALRVADGRVVTDRRKCISCHCCSEVCEKRAIVMKSPALGRAIRAVEEFVSGSKQ